MARGGGSILRDVSSESHHPEVSVTELISNYQASLLWLHEYHQHIQRIPREESIIGLQREYHRMDLEHIHLPDLFLWYPDRSCVRCSRTKTFGSFRQRLDDD